MEIPQNASETPAGPRARLLELAQARGVSLAALSDLLGRNPSYLQQFIRKGSPRKLEEQDRAKLARFFGISEEELREAQENSYVKAPKRREAGEWVDVPRLDLGASAGPGRVADGEAAFDTFRFSRRWLAEQGLERAQLSALRVEGDSMEPLLNNGDEILVDRSPRPFRDGIHVVRLGDTLMVKRVANAGPGRVALLSQNFAYPPVEVAAEEVAIIGRVVWKGGGFKSGAYDRTNHASPNLPMRAAIIPVTPLQQNCSLIWCTATMRGALVDPGGDLDKLKEGVAKAGVTLEKILVTHGHLDHCGQAGMLAEELGLDIEGPHEDDRFWIDQLDDDGPRWGMVAKSFTPTRWLQHGDTVTVGELTLDVIHCPGHTPGHVVFYHGPSRFAIVGDVLFQGSIGRTDFPRGNHQDLIESITKRLWPLGEDVMFIPGHGPTSTFGRERKTNAFVSDYALS